MIDNDTTDAQTVQLTSDVRSVTGGIYPLYNGIVGQGQPFNSYSTLYGGVYNGTSQGYTFYIYGGTFTGLEAGDFSSTSPCSTKAFTGCDIYLQFNPSAPGPRSAYFTTTSPTRFFW